MKQSTVMLDNRNRGVRVDSRSGVRQQLYQLKDQIDWQRWVNEEQQRRRRRVFRAS